MTPFRPRSYVLWVVTKASTSLGGLVNWVIVVAWHEIQAEWRRGARIELGEVPENPAGPDPAEIAESHLALDAVADGLSTLSDAERQAILSPLVGETASAGPGDARVKMRRHRARQHLAELVDERTANF